MSIQKSKSMMVLYARCCSSVCVPRQEMRRVGKEEVALDKRKRWRASPMNGVECYFYFSKLLVYSILKKKRKRTNHLNSIVDHTKLGQNPLWNNTLLRIVVAGAVYCYQSRQSSSCQSLEDMIGNIGCRNTILRTSMIER